MSLRYPGGLITKSPTAPTTSAAKGVWTLEQALQYIKAGTWPLSALGDPYFQYNTMLFPGQGTNGAQNNTFLDSSTNNFTITRNGNTTQGTFTPFSGANGNWSNFFDGNGDFLSMTGSSATNFNGTDWTIECWFYKTALSGGNENLIQSTTGTNAWVPYLALGLNNNQTVGVSLNAVNYSSSQTYSLNSWNHLAMVRSGGVVRVYLNGAATSISVTVDIPSSNLSFWIGKVDNAPGGGGYLYYFNGFLSNLRVVKGTAVYTSAFTPPTAPLTAITNTSLLTCQSNRFIDNSTNAFAITPSGNTAVTPFQPFGAPTSAYSASTVGGSGYFDGTGDTLTAPSGASISGTGDFTVETWIYPTSIPSTYSIIAAGDTSNSLAAFILNGTSGLSGAASGTISFGRTLVTPEGNTSNTINWNAWNHLLISRVSGTLKLFINGVQGYSAANTTNYVSSVIRIGSDGGGTTNYYTGYVCGIKYVQGSGVTSVTVPTTPPTATSGTSLLLNFTNAGIIDNAQDNDLETVGNAQISTTQYKWGASSMYFDGTGDSILIPDSQNFNFGAGDFTVEVWIYPTASGAYKGIFTKRESGANYSPVQVLINSGTLQLFVSTSGSAWAINANASTSPSLNTWSHIAVCRCGGTVTMYLNGVSVASGSVSTSSLMTNTARFVLGSESATDVGNYAGYMQDFRVTKGYARYLYSFTAPTAALPLFYQAAATPTADPYFDYTTLLLPGNQPSGVTDTSNNVFKDSSANNFTITRNPASGPNAPTQGTFTPFSQTGWGNFFDGTGDYLTVASSADFNIFGGDMTVECWFYSTADSLGTRSEHLFAFVQDATNRESLYFNGTTLTFWTSSGAGNGPRITYANTPQNQWIHVAVAKSGSTFTMYINGVSVGTSTTTQYSTSNQSLQIGTYNSAGAGPDSFTGYISNVRVVKGTAVYTANFIPSTTPLTSVTNTVLLTCQSNRFVDTNTQTTAKTVTPSGDTSVQAFSPFNPTAAYSASTVGGSGYFDGTGDFLSVANNAAFNFGSGAFTIEFWYYPTTLSGTQCLVTNYGGSTTGFVIQMGGSTPGSGRIDAGFSGDGADITSTNAVRLNSWNHIAISGTPGATGIKLFINGAQEGSTYTGATSLDTSSTLLIGEVASTNRLFGYLCGLRLVKGGALYTATFTPPTSPPTTTVSSGTVSLLTNFTNGAIIDNTAKHDLETVGGAAISTTQSKFGGSSMYFDGVDDNAIIPYNPIFSIGTADFTVEGWFYFSNLSTTARALVALGDGANGGGPYNAWTLRYLGSEGSNQLEFYRYDGTGFNYTTSGLTLSASTWYHIAVARYSGVLKIFVNGISYYSNTVTTNFGAINTNPMRIALQYYGPSPGYGGPRYWNGYINDLRITKGIARYTQNFTPPATAFLTL